ncbi:MAG: hypothetical protein K2M60_03125 [Lachnospiraceae bacterium]|nr:hypothetical protein [Lachnospiraceae bacterium]
MKYRYQVMINIVILVLSTCFIIYFIKVDKMNDLSKQLEYIEFEDKVNKKYEELIKFCEENQEEIVAISEEFLSIMEVDLPYDECIELKNKITNPDWSRISQILNFYDADKPWFVKYRCGKLYWKTSEYIFEVFYSAEEVDACMNGTCRHMFCQKINDHLYVRIKIRGYV